jgi:hypothetical protein
VLLRPAGFGADASTLPWLKQRRIPGLSKKMLIRVLRNLERDGLVHLTKGKTPSEHMYSGLPLVADIIWIAFPPFSEPTRIADHVLWIGAIACSAVAQQRHKIIRNGVALAGEESVSVGRRWQPPPGPPGEPTHAHLHHRH